MKTIHLPPQWQQRLAHLPETGMGSQHVDFVLKDRRVIRDVTVFNCEECHSRESFDPAEIVDAQLTAG